MPQQTYAVIGLGAMGMGLAQSLLRAGLKTVGCDVNPAALASFAEAGGQTSADPAAVAAMTDVLFLVVVNAAQMEDVLFGQGKAAQAMKPGALVVGCSTVKPDFARNMEQRLADFGLLYLDAPISGGPVKAAAGQMTVMASGTPRAFAKAEIALRDAVGTVYRLGDKAGMGSAMKVVNQLLAGVHIAVAAEAMALGLRMGLTAEDVYTVITNAAGNSWMFENRMAHVLAGDYTPLSAVDIFVKDLGIVSETTREQEMPAPMAAAALQQFVTARAQGLGQEDDAAVIKIFPGIELPSQK